MSLSPSHYLKQEPRITLWKGGPVFSLFYDYDQIRDRKLTGLSPPQKAQWFKARIEMIYLEPLRLIFKLPPSRTFNVLLDTSSRHPRSFSIALFSVMLNGVEALGSFLRPDLCPPQNNRNENKKMFRAFIQCYMADWSEVPLPAGNPNLTEFIWKRFRNGIAHGFQVEKPGSLEFLENERFHWTGEVLRVCPIHFFQDLELGIRCYFSDLTTKANLLDCFLQRFNNVYPN